MHFVLELLEKQELLLLAFLLALGAVLGQVKIKGVSIGPAAVLFAAIGVTAGALTQDVSLEIPELLGTFGLVMFTYAIGVISGPNFFASLRSGWKIILSVVAVFSIGGILTYAFGSMLGMDSDVIAGTFAGATTNTPALAAASAKAGNAAPVVGYSIAYIFGVIGMLLAAEFAIKKGGSETKQGLSNRTVRVDHHTIDVPSLEDKFGDDLRITRIRLGNDQNPTELATAETVLKPGDLATLVGPTDVVRNAIDYLGHASSHIIDKDQRELEFRRITVSNHSVVGRKLIDLDLNKFDATVSRVRRADQDMLATDDFVLQMGDRVRVIAPAQKMKEVSKFFGDSDHGLYDINPPGLAIGLVFGLLFGLVTVTLPTGSITLGAAAGTLIAGLIAGKLGRVGPIVTSMSNGAAQALSHFGLMVFLAYAGTRAGGRFVEAITSSIGWKIALTGFITTTIIASGLYLIGRFSRKLMSSPMTGAMIAGMMGGAQTQPAVLAFANSRTSNDNKVGLGYALVYPAAMITKILIAQFLVR